MLFLLPRGAEGRLVRIVGKMSEAKNMFSKRSSNRSLRAQQQESGAANVLHCPASPMMAKQSNSAGRLNW